MSDTYGKRKWESPKFSNLYFMFNKLKAKINTKIKLAKKAAFLAFIGYIYDKIANRKKTDKNKYIEDVEYEIEEKDVEELE